MMTEKPLVSCIASFSLREQFLEEAVQSLFDHTYVHWELLLVNARGGDRVTQSDVLDADAENPTATLIADLTNAEHIASNTYDCIILTQTLQFIYDTRAVFKTVYRTLKPGGVLLLTAPCMSRLDQDNTCKWGEYWRFTTYSIRKLLTEFFPVGQLTVEAYGNVLTSSLAFLYGLAAEELSQDELDHQDSVYELLVTARAVKPVELF